MYLETNKCEECYGCMACVDVCPVQCISISANSEGFIFPIKDVLKCINCGKCISVCPKSQSTKNNSIKAIYAATNPKIDKADHSSSGGIVCAIAKSFIDSGGVVYSVELRKDLTVGFSRIDRCDHIRKIQGSKYVQCVLTKQDYESIRIDLKNNRPVLFIGTPCQVAAIKKVFNNDRLFTIDFVCHGVPSTVLLNDYIHFLGEKHHGKVVDLNFRNKEKNGWSITLSYDIQKGNHIKRYYLPHKLSSYFLGFLYGIDLRESCYDCDYCSLERLGDVTLGDFWGIEKIDASLVNSNGVSIVLVNSDLGSSLINMIYNDLIIKDLSAYRDKIDVINKNLTKPTERKAERDQFYVLLREKPYKEIEKLLINQYVSRKERIILSFPYGFRQKIKRMIKRISKK